ARGRATSYVARRNRGDPRPRGRAMAGPVPGWLARDPLGAAPRPPRAAAAFLFLVVLLLQLLELRVRVLLGHGLVELLLELLGRRELVDRGQLGLSGRGGRCRCRSG